MANFLWGSAGQKMSPAQVAEQRKIAQALMAEGSDTSPVGHWTAALNRGLQGYLGGRQAYQAREAENAGRAGLEAKRAGQANAATFGGADPVAAALSGGAGLGNYAVPAGGDVATSLFPASLIETESGGNWNALNNEGYGGRLQFGAARLADAANAGIIPAGIDGAAFSRLPPEQQMAVENWHFQDIENQARRMGLDQYVGQTVAGVPIDMNAIKGMAHLGGIGGAAKFLQSGGQYNPADSNGTSLAAYGRRHGGGAAPAQSGGMSNVAELLADEWLPDSERAVLQAQYAQQLQQQDPMYQAQLQGAQLANQAAMQPQREKPLVINNQLVDPATMQVLGDYRDANNEGFNPDRYRVVGNTLFDLSAEGGPRPVADGTGTEEVIFGADGQPILVRGSAGAAKSFTEAQSKDVGFSTRMRGAEEQLAPIENALTSFSDRALNADPTGLVRGSLQSEEFQKAQQASKTWLLAFLRKDSGAATTKEEDALYGQTFLPQPGDGAGVISQKRQMRDLAMRAVEAGMSPTQAMAQARALNGNQAPPPKAAQPDAGSPQAPARINSKAEFDALPSGATFIAPDGTTRRKP